MRRNLAVAMMFLAVSTAAQAQHSHGYLFLAPGGISSGGHTAMTLHLGAGAEGVLFKGFGVGAELGALGPREDFASSVVGAASVNGYYHFVHEHVKADPYVTAGYTLLFRSGSANLFNFGGGINYWFVPRLGLKVELRDHVYRPGGSSVHYWGVRLGLAFR